MDYSYPYTVLFCRRKKVGALVRVVAMYCGVGAVVFKHLFCRRVKIGAANIKV